MSSPGSPTLIVDGHARRAELAIAAIALLAGACAPWLMLPSSAAALVCGVGCASLVAAGLHRAGWIGAAQRIARATWHAEGHWTLSRPGYAPIGAVLLGDSRITPRCVWLRWRTDERPRRRVRSMLITTSDLSQGQMRRLVVRLRLQAATSPRLPLAAAH